MDQTPPTAHALVAQAKATDLSDGGIKAADLLTAALAADPHHHEARLMLERLYQSAVPRWHFSMLGDTSRNAAYNKAIAATVSAGDIVLDIGCGAGLTAMLAARAGAAHVYACEAQPLIARAATEIIAANGLSDRITIIPKWSHELTLGEDLPRAADVVISEIVDTVLLGEGALAALLHAMATLAKPDARTVPEHGTLYAQPIESEALFHLWRPADAEGFRLEGFHPFASIAQLTPNDVIALNIRSLGPRMPLFTFDFKRPTAQPATTDQILMCDTAGACHAVMVSFDMALAPGLSVTNQLGSTGHWGRTAFLSQRAMPMVAGDRLAVHASHDCATLNLSIAPDG